MENKSKMGKVCWRPDRQTTDKQVIRKFRSGQLKRLARNSMPYQKHYEFDIEVEGQRLCEIMNAGNTLGHGDKSMCQI